MGRVGRLLGPVTLGGAAGTVGIAAWVIADRMLERPADVLEADEDVLDADRATIVEVADGTVTLDGPDAARSGTWGLAWDGGYGQIGALIGSDDGSVRRRLRLLTGEPAAGSAAVLDANAYPDDPRVLGLEVDETSYRSPIGDLPAWAYPTGDGAGTWAVLVHGRAGRRRQMLRHVPTLHALGVSCLVISYRDDPDAPASPDGHCHLGATEWQDVEGAVVYALSHGARDVVLVGNSMGGAAVLAFLRTSGHAAAVRGAVLDAPVLRWPRVIRRSAARRGAPPVLTGPAVPLALGIARARAGIDWSSIDHLGHADEFRHRMLLLHGDEDLHVPLEASRRFAERRPDLVRLRVVRGAAHLTSWNLDPEGTEAAVARFVRESDPSGGVGARTRSLVTRSLRRLRG